jgi:hypothetical protein
MTDAIGRARLVGAAIIVAVFIAGIAVGYYAIPRRVPEGVVITVKAGREMPRELEQLGLTEAQRSQIDRILTTGTQRAGRVVESLMAPMDAAIDSTDREIRQVLTETQNRALDELRKTRPLKRMRQKRVIDSTR